MTPVVQRHHLVPTCLEKFLMSSVGKISQRMEKIHVELQLPRLFAAGVSTAPHKALLQYFLVKHTCFFPIWTMPKSDNSDSENCADSQLSLIVLYSDNLRHSAMDSWVFPFLFIFKGDGGWVSISEDSALNRLLFCSFFCLLTVSNAVCLSCTFTL